jgi:predicted CopG family antitoxin
MTKEVASKRIVVTEKTWKTLHGLRKPGQTFSELIDEMIKNCKTFKSEAK